ncbi:MAG: hypothetical protein NVS3B3_20650 [Aquirhabdus sp.]
MNAHYISEGVSQIERLQKFNTLAISQMTILLRSTIKQLKS